MPFLQRSLGLLPGLLAAASGLLLVGLTSALPPVLDLRPALLCASALASLGFVADLRRPAGRIRRALTGWLALALAGTALTAAYDLTLAYRTQEVSFDNGGVTLRGTLYLPPRTGRYPAVVLVHGAGRSPRGESRFYARAYARRGIAALAYDKRGSGESSGSLADATYQELGNDAAQAVERLRRHPEVDPQRVGLRGLSEGEWTGTIAALKAQAAFLVIVSGAATTPAEQVTYETAARVRQAGYGEAAARRAGNLYRQISAFQRQGEGREALNRQLEQARSEPWFETAWYLEPSVPEYSRVLQLPWFAGWRARMDFDALPLLAELRCPVLVQEGGIDPKMDGPAALERMRRALEGGGNHAFTGLLYPRATHNIIEWRLPWHLPPPWFAAHYLDDQLGWVALQVGVGRR